MGGCASSEEEPSNQHGRKDESDGGLMSIEFKGPTKNRSCTDIQYLILFVSFIIVWIVLLGYCMSKGDIYRAVNGVDDCGNVCGRNNINKININVSGGVPCIGEDMSSKPFVLVAPKEDWKHSKRQCVANCSSEYKKYWNRCIPKGAEDLKYYLLTKSHLQTFFEDGAEDISNSYQEIIYLCLGAFALSLIMVIIYRYFAQYLVWLVVLSVIVISVATTVYLWIVWKKKHDAVKSNSVEETNATTNLIYAIVATIVTIIIALILFGLRKNIQLVAQLFEESGKAIQAMPLLLFQPFVTFIVIVVTAAVWLYFFIWIESAGFPVVKHGTTRIHYVKSSMILVARWYNIIAGFWIIQFIIGCQHMVIAGAVATWFFTRNKSQLDYPICTSLSHMVKYHLGTIAFGSLILAIIQTIRVVFKAIKSTIKDFKFTSTECMYECCSGCLTCLEKVLVFLTRNAYIEVAIYGDNLWTSGKRAFTVLTSNALRVAAINSVGDFILFLGKALVVIVTVFAAFKMLEGKENLQRHATPLVIVALFAYFVAHAFMTAFEMVIDTIFICFCEDCEMNDGVTKPYFMNPGLMEFIEKSQKVLRVGDGKRDEHRG